MHELACHLLLAWGFGSIQRVSHEAAMLRALKDINKPFDDAAVPLLVTVGARALHGEGA